MAKIGKLQGTIGFISWNKILSKWKIILTKYLIILKLISKYVFIKKNTILIYFAIIFLLCEFRRECIKNNGFKMDQFFDQISCWKLIHIKSFLLTRNSWNSSTSSGNGHGLLVQVKVVPSKLQWHVLQPMWKVARGLQTLMSISFSSCSLSWIPTVS